MMRLDPHFGGSFGSNVSWITWTGIRDQKSPTCTSSAQCGSPVASENESARRVGGRFFVYCIQYDRFDELIPSCGQLFCIDSKGSYKLFSFLPLDTFFHRRIDGVSAVSLGKGERALTQDVKAGHLGCLQLPGIDARFTWLRIAGLPRSKWSVLLVPVEVE